MPSQKATVRYDRVVMWEKQGGNHYVTFLSKGDEVEVLVGWAYSERTWKDKRYLKVIEVSFSLFHKNENHLTLVHGGINYEN